MKWWDIKTAKLIYERHLVNKFFNNLVIREGVVGDKFVKFVYNDRLPELSYILVGSI